MGDINRARLIQERWFLLLRLLLIEAFLAARLQPDLDAFLSGRLNQLVLGFALYTIVVTLLAAFRRTWPIGFAYATAAIDTIVAVLVAVDWAPETLNPGLIGVAASAVAAGVRRFPVFETFSYSFIVVFGLVAAEFAFKGQVPASLEDRLVIVGLALLPVLTRAATLAPQQGARDDPMARLAGTGSKLLGDLPRTGEATPESIYQAASGALAVYTDSQLAGVLVRMPDRRMDLFSSIDGRDVVDHLPGAIEGQLSERLLALKQTTVLTRRDDLNTQGLPDQYPTRLDTILATPIPEISANGAVLFAVNRKGGAYRPDDRLMASVLATETALRSLGTAVSEVRQDARTAAIESVLSAAEAQRPGSRDQAQECARYAVALGRQLGWEEPALVDLRLAGLLHDVGRLAIPPGLHDKQDPPTPDEYDRLKEHPGLSARIIDPFNRSETVLNAIYSHHEYWNGEGYPSGLSGEQIPLEARIMCLADCLETMLRPASGRPTLLADAAIQEVIKGSGTQFDPSVVQALLSLRGTEGESFFERRQTTIAPTEAARRGQRGAR